jgi:hypothetical protein
MDTKKEITVSGMLQHLQDGMDRKAIAAHYGITQAECKIHFQHPLLKNKKTIKPAVLTYTLVDDITAKASDVKVEATDVKANDTAKDETADKVEATDKQTDVNVTDVKTDVIEPKKEVVIGKGEPEIKEETVETSVAKATWG